MEQVAHGKLVGNKDHFFHEFEEISTIYQKQVQGIQHLIRTIDEGKRHSILNELRQNHLKIKQHNLIVFQQLAGNFFPPLDREDIIMISISYRSLSKRLYDLARKIIVYRIDIMNTYLIKLVDDLKQIGFNYGLLIELCRDFKKAQHVIDLIVQSNKTIARLNEQLDELLANLIEIELDEKLILKKKEVYQDLQLLLDVQLQGLQNIEGMVVKYA